MRYLTLLVVLFTLPLAADEPGFKSKAAKDATTHYEREVDEARKAFDDAVEKARKEYEESVKTAQKTYTDSLVEVAKSTVQNGDLDEVEKINAAIKEVESVGISDPSGLVKAQAALENTSWTWTSRLSGQNPAGFQLLTGSEARLSTQKGNWRVLDSHRAIMWFGDATEFWVLEFNRNYTEYTRIRQLQDDKHNITPGKRAGRAN